MSDRYAVIGNPLGHTKSPLIHREFARQFGEDMVYEAIEAPLQSFEATVRRFIEDGGKGINVTVPFKVAAAQMADDMHEAAQICGASNCLKFEDGRIIADNFDGIGLVRDIEKNLGIPLAEKRVLFAGAGGATRGAVVPFLRAGVREIVIANRTVEKAADIARMLANRGPVKAASYGALDGDFDLVLNATSASLTGGRPPVPEGVFQAAELAYDLAYGRGKTPFLAFAEHHGASRIADGVGMLAEQAAEAFFWWRGNRPDTRPVIKKIEIPLD